MKKQLWRGRLLIFMAAVLLTCGLTGCELFQNFLGPGGVNDSLPLEAFLIYGNGQWLTLYAHPTIQDGGLVVTVGTSEPCHVDWDDGTEVGQTGVGNTVSHTYIRQGTYAIRCWTDVVDRDWKEAELTVVVENQRPDIGPYIIDDSQLNWRQNMEVLLNPHVAGCDSATGEFMYMYGTSDPDGDPMQMRINVWLVQEVLRESDGVQVGWHTVEKWTVFSLHDRSRIGNQWAPIWGFWFQVGWTGALPPFPFNTWPYEALAPRSVLDHDGEEVLMSAMGLPSPMDWPGPDWPDQPGWPPASDPDPDPDPDPEEEPTVLGDCFTKVMEEGVDPWGGYRHQVWFIPLNGCGGVCAPGPGPTVPPITPPTCG